MPLPVVGTSKREVLMKSFGTEGRGRCGTKIELGGFKSRSSDIMNSSQVVPLHQASPRAPGFSGIIIHIHNKAHVFMRSRNVYKATYTHLQVYSLNPTVLELAASDSHRTPTHKADSSQGRPHPPNLLWITPRQKLNSRGSH